MKKSILKRLITFVLAVSMILSCCSISAFAETASRYKKIEVYAEVCTPYISAGKTYGLAIKGKSDYSYAADGRFCYLSFPIPEIQEGKIVSADVTLDIAEKTLPTLKQIGYGHIPGYTVNEYKGGDLFQKSCADKMQALETGITAAAGNIYSIPANMYPTGGEGKRNLIVGFEGGSAVVEERALINVLNSKIEFVIDTQAKQDAQASVPSQVNDAVVLKIGSSDALAAGKTVKVDSNNAAVMPQIINDRTLVPARFIAESFGGEVGWEDATKTVTIKLNGRTVTMVLDKNELMIDGQVAAIMDVPAQTIEERTMVPLRVLCETALSKKVFWDDKGLIVISDVDNILDSTSDAATIDSVLAMLGADNSNVPSTLYVALTGNDSNAGTKEAPLATLEAAKQKVRSLLSAGNVSSPITVNIEEGNYYVDKSFTLDDEDSGMVTWQAAEGAEVNFIGGKKIDSSRISKVEDQSVLRRIIDARARGSLMQIDLSDIDITPLGDSTGNTINYVPTEIYYNDKALQPARWPNKIDKNNGYDGEYAYVNKLESSDEAKFTTSPFTGYFLDEENRIEQYWKNNPMKDICISNYFAAEWSHSVNRIASIDAKNKSFTTVGGLAYKPQVAEGKTKRFYFFNVLEEIDVPGEMYIDRDKKIAYFYPEGDPSSADIHVSTMTEPILNINGASNVTVKNLNFMYTRGLPVYINDVSDFTFDGCKIAHTSSNAVSMTSAKNSVIKNCDIYDAGRGGIVVEGCGNRSNLISSGVTVENNIIHDVTRIAKTYISAVKINGSCGVTVRGNTMYNSPHLLMGIAANNDLVIENNEFYNAITDVDDSGTIYWGKDTSTVGYVIRNNYFHDMSNEEAEFGVPVIYCDDMGTHAEIYNNIFYKCGIQDKGVTRCVGGSGMYASIYNNIFVENDLSAQIGSGETPTFYFSQNIGVAKDGKGRYPDLNRLGFFDNTWREHYKGTNWERLWEYYTDENLAYVKALIEKSGTDYATISPIVLPWARTIVSTNNLFTGNVSITQGAYRAVPGTKDMYGVVKFVDDAPVKGDIRSEGNYTSNTDKLSSGASMFVEYGKNFKLTDEGLNFIKQTIPDFKNIDTSVIGAKR